MNENFADQLDLLPRLLAEHLSLTVIALAVGTLVSLPVAVFASKWKAARWPVLAAAGVIQTIPSLALLALMVPVLYLIPGLSSLGFWPAIIALTLYSMLPILRNTVTGITGVDAALLEAARGIGMTPTQSLLKVELPLAMPVIIAGLRTATVWVVGIATLSEPIGQPSLGTYIFSGLTLQNWTAVLFGCVAAAVLAMVLDGLIAQLESGAMRRSKVRVLAATAGLLVVFAGGIAAPYAVRGPTSAGDTGEHQVTDTGSEGVKRPTVVRVGAKDFAEQYIVARLLQSYLEDAGFEVQVTENLGSGVIFSALGHNDLDVYVEYTGTVWLNHMKRQTFAAPWKVKNIVAGWLARQHNVRLAATLGFENTYALAMSRKRAEELNITSIDDLVEHAPQMRIASTTEFFGRPEWQQLRDTYGLQFADTVGFDPTFMYGAVDRGEVDVISAFSTDGRIAAYDLLVLRDTRRVFPPYDAIVLLSPQASTHPAIAQALAPLHQAIPATDMRRANQLVDVDGQTVSAAAQWLRETIDARGHTLTSSN